MIDKFSTKREAVQADKKTHNTRNKHKSLRSIQTRIARIKKPKQYLTPYQPHQQSMKYETAQYICSYWRIVSGRGAIKVLSPEDIYEIVQYLFAVCTTYYWNIYPYYFYSWGRNEGREGNAQFNSTRKYGSNPFSIQSYPIID